MGEAAAPILDVSPTPVLAGAHHWYQEPDQLYRPHASLGLEAFQEVFARDLINESKYTRILLYELFLLLRPGGRLVLEFHDNALLTLSRLQAEIGVLHLLRGRCRHTVERGAEGRHRVVVTKTASARRDPDLIHRWSFGIVTNGKRVETIRTSIESIRALKIPAYEILVCGSYGGAIDADMRYLPFTEQDDKGWITRKKNLICEQARYENICVIHDRIYFDPGWYDGMRAWGAQFEVLGCPLRIPHQGREIDSNWETVHEDFKLPDDDYRMFHTNGLLDLSDWDPYVHIPGAIHILSREAWQAQPWDNALFWGDAEDIALSRAQHAAGLMVRLNPHAVVRSTHQSGVVINAFYEKNRQARGRFHTELSWPTRMALKTLDLLGVRRNQAWVRKALAQVKKIYGAHSWKDEKK